MELLDKRIKGICNELKRLWVKQSFPILDWMVKEGNYVHPADAEGAQVPWSAFDSKTMHWYGPDRHYWFKAAYQVPKELAGKSMWLKVRTQIDEPDDAKNPQFLLFVNGEPVQGMDMNHREVLISSCPAEGEELVLELQAYTGILHCEFNMIATMEEWDQEIRKLYYDLWVPLAAFPRMKKDDRNRMLLEDVLNRAINYLDLRTPYSPEFYASLREGTAYLEQALYQDMAGFNEVVASCIGHTHIDVAWWWTVAQTREKVARSFATVLKLMEEYPGYQFMSSQPQLYVFLKERYPELYSKVKERVKEGRWEPEGGMWVEADCNLTSGESLVRQFLYGKRFFKEEFGIDNRILWLPDVFGYSGALPQIMKKCGIDYFMTTKLAWNQFNKIPYDTMLWKGIDGSQILTHLITTQDVGQSPEDFFTTYNGQLHPDAIMGGWDRYQNKDINNDILISYGFGDGGGGPTREMLETSARMEKGIKGIPKVRQEFAGTWFRQLDQRVMENNRLPVWEGELYFEYHRGTYTSMARNKRSNRKAELGLMDLELLSVLASPKMAFPDPREMEKLWKTVLINQFHDILPGSSIHQVYQVTKEEYQALSQKLHAMIQERLDALSGTGEGITVYNTTGHERNDLVWLKEGVADGAAFLKDEDGRHFPVQQVGQGAVAYVEGLPSKGYKAFWPVAGTPGDGLGTQTCQAFQLVSERELDTPFYRVAFDQQGMITSLYDKKEERQLVREGQRANLLRMYEDKPIYYDCWDIDIFYTEKYWDVDQVERMEWTQMGPVRATLSIQRRVSNSVICQDIHFYANLPRIDFSTWVDWKEHQHLLKVHFPMDLHTDEASFDIQFGNLKRKIHTNTSWDMARFESCGQKWMDMSEGHYGVSLLNDCKYGHSVKDGAMALTLIKSGIEPNPTADQEEHQFTYSLYPHQGNGLAGTAWAAYDLNQPALAAPGVASGAYLSWVKADKPNVVVETVKVAEDGDGCIVRLYECENARTKVNLTFASLVLQARECNLIEENLEAGEEPVVLQGNVVQLLVKPYEVKTIRVNF